MKFVPLQLKNRTQITHLRIDQILSVRPSVDSFGEFARIELLNGDYIETIMSVKSVLFALESISEDSDIKEKPE